VFFVQHAVMARPGFKRWWTKIIPAAAERSTFVLVAGLLMCLMWWLWRPIPTVLWSVTDPIGSWVLTGLSVMGWAIAYYATFLINHFDLFGLRQGWLRMMQKPYTPVGFRLVSLYRYVRHPLMVGFLFALWATPVMTLGHLYFSLMFTAYIFIGTRMEERDLIAQHGEKYEAYRRKVGGFVPRLAGRDS
jgi:protein-S-isoprenylcysteine O-methyltransferase Ste14